MVVGWRLVRIVVSPTDDRERRDVSMFVLGLKAGLDAICKRNRGIAKSLLCETV